MRKPRNGKPRLSIKEWIRQLRGWTTGTVHVWEYIHNPFWIGNPNYKPNQYPQQKRGRRVEHFAVCERCGFILQAPLNQRYSSYHMKKLCLMQLTECDITLISNVMGS